jgi:hypothetical protein
MIKEAKLILKKQIHNMEKEIMKSNFKRKKSQILMDKEQKFKIIDFFYQFSFQKIYFIVFSLQL